MSELHTSTVQRMHRVLGADRADRLLRDGLAAIGCDQLETADDLYRFALWLGTSTGFEQALGSLLAVQAVMRGAGRKVTDPDDAAGR